MFWRVMESSPSPALPTMPVTRVVLLKKLAARSASALRPKRRVWPNPMTAMTPSSAVPLLSRSSPSSSSEILPSPFLSSVLESVPSPLRSNSPRTTTVSSTSVAPGWRWAARSPMLSRSVPASIVAGSGGGSGGQLTVKSRRVISMMVKLTSMMVMSVKPSGMTISR